MRLSNELKVGLVVIFAALALFFGIRFLEDRPFFGGGYPLVAVFENAQGVSPGTLVFLSGVKVGAVESVRLSDDARRVYFTLEMEPGFSIPRGSTVGTSGLAALGSVTVAITPPAEGDGRDALEPGDTLYTVPGGDLFTELSARAPQLAARADTLLASAALTFDATHQLITATEGDVAATLAELRQLTATSNALLLSERARLSATLVSLQRAAAGAEALTADLRRFSAENSDSLALTVRQLNRTLTEAERGLAGLGPVTARLDTTLATLNNPDGTLGLFLRDPSLYNNANAATLSLQQLLYDFQQNPARYLRDLRLVDIF